MSQAAFVFLIAAISFAFCAPPKSIAYSQLAKYEKTSIEEYLKTPDKDLSVTIGALIISKTIFSNTTFKPYWDKVNELARSVMKEVGQDPSPDLHIAALNTVLFKDNHYRYDKTDREGEKSENHTLKGIIDNEMGVCTALPLLYICVAERCGFPIYGVSSAQHSFARYEIPDFFGKGKPYQNNIEATCFGVFIPDVDYIDSFKIPKNAFKNGVYLRTLTKREYIYELMAPIASHYRRLGNLGRSIYYIKLSLSGSPKNSLLWRSLAIKNYSLMTMELEEIDRLEQQKDFMLRSQGLVGMRGPNISPDFQDNRPQVSTRPSALVMLEADMNRGRQTGSGSQMAIRSLDVRIEERVEKTKFFLEEHKTAWGKMNELGIAPLIDLKEYYRFVKLPEDRQTLLPEGGLKTEKFTLNGVDYDVSPQYKEKVRFLMEKYRSYFDEK